MILCENCQKNVATVHLTEIIQKEKKEIHLCNTCAKDKGVSLKPFFILSDALGELDEEESVQPVSDLVCENCGITYEEFRSLGRLGCARDYEVFKPHLIPFMEKIHGSLFHAGKVPNNTDLQVKQAQHVMRIRRLLNEAVEQENYEEAARLRDQLQGVDIETDETD